MPISCHVANRRFARPVWHLPPRYTTAAYISNNCTGHSTLPSSCPVCEHSPLSASDCNPNKALRTTIRVFLKTEEKKRGIGQPKEKDATPVTPVDTKDVTPSVIPEKVGEIVEVTDVADASQSQDDHALAAPSEELKGTPVVEEAIDANTSSDAKVRFLYYEALTNLLTKSNRMRLPRGMRLTVPAMLKTGR